MSSMVTSLSLIEDKISKPVNKQKAHKHKKTTMVEGEGVIKRQILLRNPVPNPLKKRHTHKHQTLNLKDALVKKNT